MSEPGEVPGPEDGEALERLLLDGLRRYTRLQVAELAGMPPERSRRLWRALGLPERPAGAPALPAGGVTGAHGARRHGAEGALAAHRLRLRRTGDRGLDRAGHGAGAVPARRLADRHAGRRP